MPRQAAEEILVGSVTPDTPLRLAVAAKLAFPAGGMTEAGLRREGERGRLAMWKMAGKLFTTLRAIQEMGDQCRVPQKDPTSTSTSARAERRSGSSGTDHVKSARAALRAIAQGQSKPSPATSTKSTNPNQQVVTLPSRTSS
jgi:hypothetical protein